MKMMMLAGGIATGIFFVTVVLIGLWIPDFLANYREMLGPTGKTQLQRLVVITVLILLLFWIFGAAVP